MASVFRIIQQIYLNNIPVWVIQGLICHNCFMKINTWHIYVSEYRDMKPGPKNFTLDSPQVEGAVQGRSGHEIKLPEDVKG